MAEEVEQNIDSATNGADVNSVLDKENDQEDAHKSEYIVDETENEPTPRRRTRSQGKTRTFIIPDTASPQMIHRMNHQPPKAASVVSRRVPSISAVSNNFSPSPHDRVKPRKLLQLEAEDQLNPSQPSLQAEISGGCTD
jgi:hypothetical protein